MASSTPVCGICDLQQVNRPASIWCTECNEGLCSECQKHHAFSKATQRHSTISISQYLSLPANILQIKEYCAEHGEKFRLYCKTHDCPCCLSCVVNRHNKCEDVTAIETVIRKDKISNMIGETENYISEILETIQDIRKNRTIHLSSVKQQKQNLEQEILAVRLKINKHLDQVQETLINELAEVEAKTQKQYKEFHEFLIAHEKELKEFQITMSTIKQFATDLKTFISLHGIERDVSFIDKSIQTLIETDSMKNTTLSCEIENKVQHFPTLGKIIVKSQPCEITISRRKNKQAQIMVAPTPSGSIENITLKLQQTINTRVKWTTGCALLPDGRMLFSCYNAGRVRSMNEDGTQDFDTGALSSQPYDITYIEDTNSIAVTSGGSYPRCIRIINMGSGHIEKTISVKSECYGIVYRNNKLIYCAGQKGLRMVDLNDESESDVLSGQMSPFSYVAAYRNKLYYTNCNKHTVTCCDLQGRIQWHYKDESILTDPYGVTVDNEGNVYVVGYRSFNVVVISSDGQLGRQLLRKEDELQCPLALNYDRSRNQILVANRTDVAFIFQIAKSQ